MSLTEHSRRLKVLTKALQKSHADHQARLEKERVETEKRQERERLAREKNEKEQLERERLEEETRINQALEKIKAEQQGIQKELKEWILIPPLQSSEKAQVTNCQQAASSMSKALIWGKVQSAMATVSAAAYTVANSAAAAAVSAGTMISSGIQSGASMASHYLKS